MISRPHCCFSHPPTTVGQWGTCGGQQGTQSQWGQGAKPVRKLIRKFWSSRKRKRARNEQSILCSTANAV